ncbi:MULTISPECIES: response regulator transcription factor [unclassified Nonomuraea]|uniref:response regulator transcription factor n=1 Tax=unclassified Nonomuraea TaxID=2593643 RepID=UPI003416DD3C
MTIRVVLADDQQLVRAGFRSLLEMDADIEVVAEAENGVEAVEVTRRERPDIVLIDIRMPRLDGLAATREIMSDPALEAVKVIVLTTFEVNEYIFDALKAGASGFLTKTVDSDELRRAVRVVADGQALLTPSVTRRVIEEFSQRPDGGALDGVGKSLDTLTDREREVMAMVAAGRNNTEIGAALHMSPLTAKTHVSRIIAKLGIRDRTQLVVLAYESGLVSPRRS